MTGADVSPVTRSYLVGAGVGAAVGLVLVVAPFVPWRVAVIAGLLIGAVTVVFVRSIIDPAFLAGEHHVAPYADEDWRLIAAADQRRLREMAPAGGDRLKLRRSDETRDDIPAADLLVASKRAGAR